MEAFDYYYSHVFVDLPIHYKFIGTKPKNKPRREKTEEEKKFKRRAKYFLATQLVAILVFLSVLGGSNDAEVELGDDYE